MIDVMHAKEFYDCMMVGISCTEEEHKQLQTLGATEWEKKEIESWLECYRKFEKIKSVEPETLSIEATLAQRGKRYGDFSDHARLCQNLMADLHTFSKVDQDGIAFCPWGYLDPVKKQALTVICDKLARILSGDPNYDDNWIDIQGYAKLVQDRLPKESN